MAPDFSFSLITWQPLFNSSLNGNSQLMEMPFVTFYDGMVTFVSNYFVFVKKKNYEKELRSYEASWNFNYLEVMNN